MGIQPKELSKPLYANNAYKDIDRIMLMQESLAEIHGRSMSRIVRMNKE